MKKEVSICQSLLCLDLVCFSVLSQIEPQAPLLVVPFRQFLKVSGLRSYSPQNPQTLISLRFQLATILLSEPKNCDFSQGSYLRLDIKGQGLVFATGHQRARICDWTSKAQGLVFATGHQRHNTNSAVGDVGCSMTRSRCLKPPTSNS